MARRLPDRLSHLVTGRDVRCRLISTDQYGRSVSSCTVGATDINAAIVENGFATAYRQYSTDYVAAEARAKAAKRGIWSGTFRGAPRLPSRGKADPLIFPFSAGASSATIERLGQPIQLRDQG